MIDLPIRWEGGDGEILRNGGILVMAGWFWNGGRLIPLYGLCNFTKNELHHLWFPKKLLYFYRTAILINRSGRMLPKTDKRMYKRVKLCILKVYRFSSYVYQGHELLSFKKLKFQKLSPSSICLPNILTFWIRCF